jgi:hypothetical protein
MFVIHDTLPNQKNEKIIQCPFIKSFFFLKVMVFPKIKVQYPFIAYEV